MNNSKGFQKIALIIFILVLVSGLAYWYFFIIKAVTPQKQVSGQSGWCQGVKIVFFPGGGANDSFAKIVYNGARLAEQSLGASVEYVWSDWDSDKMLTQFKNSISNSPDGICLMGHPGSEAFSPLIDEAERKNIIVTSQNVDLTDVREKYTASGFGYVGQNLYNSGLMVSNGVIRKYHPAEGSEAIVFGVDSRKNPNRYERTKGCVDGLEKEKIIVHQIVIPAEVEKDATSNAGRKMISDALGAYPNAKIMIIDHGAVTSAVVKHLEELGEKPGKIIIAGFDLSSETVRGIKNGYIGLIQDQQPFLQGYLPILQTCLTKKFGFAGLSIDTGVGLIDSSNVDFVSTLAEQGIR